MIINVVQTKEFIELLTRIAVATERIAANTAPTVPSGIAITATGEKAMSKVKFSLRPAFIGKGSRAVQPPITITNATDAIAIEVLDQNGAPITGIDPTKVTTTFTSDNPAFAVTAGADSLHYSASIPAGTTGTANLSATLTFLDGSAGPFSASVAATLNVAPTPPKPTDIAIVVS